MNQTSSSSKPQIAPDTNSKLAKLRVVIIFLVIIGLAGFFGWQSLNDTSFSDKTRLFASGRVEGYDTDIGAKIGGRVESIKYREGQFIKKGELVAKLADDDIQAQLRAAKARTRASEALVRQRKEALDVVQWQINEAKLQVSKSKESVSALIDQSTARKAQAEAELAEADARLTEAQSSLQLATKRKERFEKLLKRGAVTRDEYDQAITNFETGKATLVARRSAIAAAKRKLTAADATVRQSRSDRFDPSMREIQLASLKSQLIQAKHQLENARQEVSAALAKEAEIEANIEYLTLRSPVSGFVTARPVEPGAVVVPGATILTVIDLDKLFLRAYIPEKDIARTRVGDKAEVVLDSFPNKPFKGKIIEIDTVASFTPENIYFKDDRVKQSFGIKIGIDNPDGFAKPGMPADAHIFTKEPGSGDD